MHYNTKGFCVRASSALRCPLESYLTRYMGGHIRQVADRCSIGGAKTTQSMPPSGAADDLKVISRGGSSVSQSYACNFAVLQPTAGRQLRYTRHSPHLQSGMFESSTRAFSTAWSARSMGHNRRPKCCCLALSYTTENMCSTELARTGKHCRSHESAYQ